MIDVQHVTKSLGGRHILNDVTFSIDAGIVALLGRNGAGKTTLMRILSGIWHPDAGTVSIGGHTLADDAVAAKRALGFQPEFPDLHPAVRGRELLEFVAAARGLSGDAMDAAVARFDVAELLDRPAGALSQGQRRALTLVAATMHDPPILLLDEPTNALDPHRVAALRSYLASTAAPRAVLVSTHQLDFVVTIAQRFILLREGRVVADGSLSGLRDTLRMPNASLEEIVVRTT